MESKITDKDIEILCAVNPMASEQLRRIVAERQRTELEMELAELKRSDIESANSLINGVMDKAIASPAE
jgi:hypothetical protein